MKNTLISIAAVFLFCSPLMAIDLEITRETLKGLPGVRVIVEAHTLYKQRAGLSTEQNAPIDGLSKDQIQTDVELRLRMAGIKVLTEAECNKAPGFPTLFITLIMAGSKEIDLYYYSLNIGLCQWVTLVRDPKISIGADTWSSESIGSTGSNEIGDVRNGIKDKVDKFINAWLSVNPKK
jgi:hypothetical protein